MTEAGLGVTETRYDYTDDLDLDHLVGGVYSALPAQRLPPPDQRTAFAAQIHRRCGTARTIPGARPREDAARPDRYAGQSQKAPTQLRQDPAAVSTHLAYAQLTQRSSDGKTETGQLRRGDVVACRRGGSITVCPRA